MLIGVMSDSHDHIENIKKAISIFNDRNVSMVLHAGDYTSPFSLIPFKELKAEFRGIFGNNDGDLLMLNKRGEGQIHQQPYEFTLQEKKFVMVHEHFLVNALADSGHYDIVIYGHTHQPVAERRGKSYVLNPGETGGWLYGKASIAILDLEKTEAEIINF